MTRALLAVLACTAVVVACGGNGSAATPKRPAVRIAEPGPLYVAPDGGLIVGDRRLNRVVRFDLATRSRRVLASGLRDIVGLAYDDSGRLYVAAANRIYRIDRRRKVVVAGDGRRAHTGDGGRATAASLSGVVGFDVDHDERIAIAEYDGWVRVVEANGTIGTLAGTGAAGYDGDGGPAREATLNHPHDVAWRRDSELVIADSHNGALRSVDARGTIRTLARDMSGPIAVQGGPLDTLYVADARLGVVFRIDPDGRRTQVANAGTAIGMAVDDERNVYVSELDRRRVVRFGPGGRRTVLISR